MQEKGKVENKNCQTEDVIYDFCSDLETKFLELRTQHGLVVDENQALHEQVLNMSHHRSEMKKLEKALQETREQLKEIDPLRQKVK